MTALIKRKLQDEINLIPESKLSELYSVIHYFRLGVESSQTAQNEPESFAGCWKDMDDSVFEEMMIDINQRRNNAFSQRRQHESHVD